MYRRRFLGATQVSELLDWVSKLFAWPSAVALPIPVALRRDKKIRRLDR